MQPEEDHPSGRMVSLDGGGGLEVTKSVRRMGPPQISLSYMELSDIVPRFGSRKDVLLPAQ